MNYDTMPAGPETDALVAKLKPVPNAFGLSPDRLKFFRREHKRIARPEGLGGFMIWGLIMGFGLLMDHRFRGLGVAIFLVSLSGLALLALSGRFFDWIDLRRKEAVRLSKLGAADYDRYLAYEHWCSGYEDFLRGYQNAKAEREAEERRREAEERRQQLAWWRDLDDRTFEREIANLLRKRGYQVELTGGAGDGGVDLVLRSDERTVIVQCKAHKGFISPGPVRDLYGTVIHSKADEGWLVTTYGFHGGAKAFAQGKPLKLVLLADLLKLDR